MELNELKEQWNQENTSKSEEFPIEFQYKLQSPLDKIRSNMRMEFWNTIICLVLGSSFLLFAFTDVRLRIYMIAFIIAMTLVTAFFFIRFYKLYRETNSVSLTTKDALQDIYMKLKVYEQLYFAYYVSFLPFIICEMILLSETTNHFNFTKELLYTFVIGTFITVVFVLVFSYLWHKYYYGVHIENIKSKLDECS